MSTINVLGPVGFNPTGPYDATRTYQKLDVVYYQGSSYVAISDSLGQLPTNADYWLCIAAGSLKQFVYDSVASMKADNTLADGMTVQTLGYYEINDGGAATYKITDEESETEYQEELESGLYATLIINDIVNVKTLGAKCDGLTDDSNIFQYALDNFNVIELPENLSIIWNKRYQVRKNTEIIGNNATILITDAEEHNTRYKTFELLDNYLLKISDLNFEVELPENSFSSWDWNLFYGTSGNLELNNVKSNIHYTETNKPNFLFVNGKSNSIICNNVYSKLQNKNLAGGTVWLQNQTGIINAIFNNCIFEQESTDEIIGVYGKYQANSEFNNCTIHKIGTSHSEQIITSTNTDNNANQNIKFNNCNIVTDEGTSTTCVIFMVNNAINNVVNKQYFNDCIFNIDDVATFFGGGRVGNYVNLNEYKEKLMIQLNNCIININNGCIHISAYPSNIIANKCIFTTNESEFNIYDQQNTLPYEEKYIDCIFNRISGNDNFLVYSNTYGIIQKFINCGIPNSSLFNNNKTTSLIFENDYFIKFLNCYILSSNLLYNSNIPSTNTREKIKSVTPTTSTSGASLLNNSSFVNYKTRIASVKFQINLTGNVDEISVAEMPVVSNTPGILPALGYDGSKYYPVACILNGSALTIYNPQHYSVIRVYGVYTI